VLGVNPLESLPRMDAASPEWKKMREKVALQELEHQFAYTLLQELKTGLGKDGLFGASNAASVYDDMLNDSLASEWAKTGQLGIANLVARALSERSENQFHQLVPIAPFE
jgi:Rod binding domain-containing protein